MVNRPTPTTGSTASEPRTAGQELLGVVMRLGPKLICTWPGCGLPDRLHGAPDRSRVTHSGHWFCVSTESHSKHLHGPEREREAAALPAALRVEYNTGRTHGYEEGYRAAAAAGLDVERLNRAAYRTPMQPEESMKEWLYRVAAAYAAETPEPEASEG